MDQAGGMTAHADLRAARGINRILSHRVGGPVGRRTLCAQPVRHVLVTVGVGIEVNQRHRSAARELAARPGNGLEDRPGDRVIAANCDRPRAGRIQPREIGLDVANAGLVVHGLWQRHVAKVADAQLLKGRDVVNPMGPSIEAGDIAHGAWPKVLVALGRAVAAAVRNAHQGDIALRRVFVPGAAEERGNAPPVPGGGGVLGGFEIILGHDGSTIDCVRRRNKRHGPARQAYAASTDNSA